ncbi:hypothetical protein [Persicirhabdus sediminis]|uniref:Uncharacterized protein n=1 Tax=Persicirhabdus sediminis TaxID=454144 RepID=A0A8J7MIJ0_9BACT|nr:hypothetical protein [Persicirhabdus sediminis]MBK1792634.1 hypothetical protein [Persicirhabdus sediminis]
MRTSWPARFFLQRQIIRALVVVGRSRGKFTKYAKIHAARWAAMDKSTLRTST